MSPRDDHIDRGHGIRIVLEDTKSLLRPTDFATFHVPTKTAGLAKSLGLCQIGLAAAQGVLRPLTVLDIGVGALPFDDVSVLIAHGAARFRNQRYCPLALRIRPSLSQGIPEAMPLRRISTIWSTSSGWYTARQPKPSAS